MYCITQDKTLKEFDEVFGEIIGVGQCDSQVYASIERSGKVTIFNVTENKEVADINVTVTAPAAKMVNSTEKDHMTVVIDSAAYKVGIKNGNVEQILKGNDISGLADDANVDRMIEVQGTTDLYALVTLGKTVDGKRHYELMRITKGDGDTVSGDQQDEREEIRIAVTEKTPILTELIYQFNQENKEFRMTVEVYDSEDGKNHILTDLSTGKVPDIIATDLIELDVLVQKQIVCDLNEMLEADETLSKDSFVGKSLEIFERDGKIYALPSRLGVSGLSGKQSMLKDLDGKTLEEFRRFASEKANACAGVSKENMLRCIMELNLSAFLDEGMKECNFDNADFCNILNYVNMYQNQEMVITSLSDFEEKVKMQEVIMYPVLLTDPLSYQFYEALWGKDICFIGYPSTDGNGIQLCSLGESYMITRNSAHKKEAWELLKSIVMDHSLMDSGMPAYKELFEECLENAAEKKMEDDGTGNLIEVPKYTYYFDDVELELNALSEDEEKGLRGLLEKATPVKQSSKVISDIILEETKAFFDGTTSAENVAKIIQNRAQNYLNEQ